MSSGPFNIALVIDRLRTQVPSLQLVAGTTQYAAITNLREFRPDSAFVLLARERGDGEQPKAGGRQRALVTFGVVLAVRNYRDQIGSEALEEVSPLIAQVRGALMGWIPPVDGGRPCQWLQGDVLDYDDSTLLWSDVFQTQHFIGSTP